MDDLVAVVFIENGSGDDSIQGNTPKKKRIHHADLIDVDGDDDNKVGMLMGETLERLIIADYDDDDYATRGTTARNSNIYLVEIYDSNVGDYRSLKHQDYVNQDFIKLFGSRLRVRLVRSPQQSQKQQQQSDLLAIEGRFYPYDGGITIKGIRIEVEEQANDPSQGTAGNVWDGALLLTKFMEKNPEMLSGKKALELGAGCGLVGIAAGILGAEQVILTDLPHALPLINKNIDHHRTALTQSGCQSINSMACDWFQPLPNDLDSFHPDIILIADCVWMQELVAPLLVTIKRFTEDDRDDQNHASVLPQQVLISYQRRGKPTHEAFMSGLHSLFTIVNEVDTYATCKLKKPPNLYIFDCRR